MTNPYPILNVEEVVLRTPTTTVVTAEEAIKIIEQLETAMEQFKGCVGLAAPQIGISKAVAIIRHEEREINLINPTILETTTPFVHRREGCMSFPGKRFDVPRFRLIRYETDALWSYENNKPEPVFAPDYLPGQPTRLVRRETVSCADEDEEDPAVSLIAIAVQHEIDHLLGLCLPWKEGAVEVEGDPIIRPVLVARVGRNDPCPCGATDPVTGRRKKFKKCCGKI